MFIPSFLSIISASLAATCLRPLLPDGVQLPSNIDKELHETGGELNLRCQDYTTFRMKCEENGTWSGDNKPVCLRFMDQGLPAKISSGQCQTDCGVGMSSSYGYYGSGYQSCNDPCTKPTTEWTQDLLDSPDVLGVRISRSYSYFDVLQLPDLDPPAFSLEISSSSTDPVKCRASAQPERIVNGEIRSYVSCPLRKADRISIRFSEPISLSRVEVVVKSSRSEDKYRSLPGYTVGGKYIFVESKMNYTEAKKTCEKNEAELLGETTEVEEELLKMRMEYWNRKQADTLYVSGKSLRTPRWIGLSAGNGDNAMAGTNWAKTYVNPEEEHYTICQFSRFNCTNYPGIPEAGRIIEHVKGFKVSYECFDGYSMAGPSTRTCNKATGEYEPDMPTCAKRFR